MLRNLKSADISKRNFQKNQIHIQHIVFQKLLPCVVREQPELHPRLGMILFHKTGDQAPNRLLPVTDSNDNHGLLSLFRVPILSSIRHVHKTFHNVWLVGSIIKKKCDVVKKNRIVGILKGISGSISGHGPCRAMMSGRQKSPCFSWKRKRIRLYYTMKVQEGAWNYEERHSNRHRSILRHRAWDQQGSLPSWLRGVWDREKFW